MNESLILVGGSVFQENTNGQLVSKSPLVSYVHDLTKYFRRVIWVANFEDGTFLDTVIDVQKVTCHPIRREKGLMFKSIHLVQKQAIRGAVTLLWLPDPFAWIQLLLLRIRGRAVFVYIGNDYRQYSQEWQRKRGKAYAWYFRLSTEIAVMMAKGVIVRGEKLKHQVNMLNANVLETVPLISRATNDLPRHRRLCAGSEIQILYVGKLNRDKGVHLLLETMFRLRRKLSHLQLKLWIVGSGPAGPLLQGLTRSLSLEDIVTFHGYIDDPNRLGVIFAEADIVVVPSIAPEGVPRVIDEAIMYQNIVVASKVGGIGSEFRNGEVIFVEPNKVLDLMVAIQRVIEDAAFRESVLYSGQQRRERLMNMPTTARQHSQFVRSTCVGGDGCDQPKN